MRLLDLAACAAMLAGAAAAPAAAADLTGQEVFDRHCVHCHGPGNDAVGTLQLARTRGKDKALLTERKEANVYPATHFVMRHLEETLHGRVSLVMSSTLQIEESVRDADVVIGAVLIPGALAPKLLTREMVQGMKEGSVFCDVAIDQGGCAETSHATTHDDPVYEVDGVIHYCVANMPGAVPITSTKALTNVTLPYVEAIADQGLADAVERDKALARGVNVIDGKITYEAVAEAHGLEYTPLEDVLGAPAV